jgi:hypothetical protein
VRRRWNTRELVQAALIVVATSALLGVPLVLAALATAPRRFVAVVTLLAAVWLASALAIGLATRRRWLRRSTAHRQIDRHARLAGRLAAIVDLGPREVSALRPLLAAECAAILPLWDARRLVPRRTPAGALAAAVAAGIALLSTLALAPVLMPPPAPARIVRDVDARGLRGGRTDRLSRGGAIAAVKGRGSQAGGEESRLASMAEALQYRLHRELWGEAEAIRAQELAQSEGPMPTDQPRADVSEKRNDDDGGESTRRVEPGSGSDEPESSGTEVATNGGTPEAGDTATAGEAARARGTADGAARGAGSGTSPDLYGAPTDGSIHRTAAPFTLGLTADVRLTGGGSRPPTGDTPSQLPDASPALAERPREAVAVPRAPVPPEYAAVVRRLFEREP